MHCKKARTLVAEADEERWSAAAGAALRTHLAGCAACSRLQRRSALARRWLQELPESEPAPNFEWRLKLRLSQVQEEGVPLWPAESSNGRRWLLPFALSTAAASACVLALGLAVAPRLHEKAAPQTARVAPSPPGPWAASPVGRPTVAWPRLVPVRASSPLGPDLRLEAPASIVGTVPADTVPEARRRRVEPVETVPVRW